MYLLYFALWIILNGRITVEICLFGVVIAGGMYAFSRAFLRHKHQSMPRRLHHIPRELHFLYVLICEIVKANLNTMRLILSVSEEPKPVLVHFRTDLKTTAHRVLLANTITLTPGTITCSLDEDALTVHCLDESLAEGLNDGEIPRLLTEMEADA